MNKKDKFKYIFLTNSLFPLKIAIQRIPGTTVDVRKYYHQQIYKSERFVLKIDYPWFRVEQCVIFQRKLLTGVVSHCLLLYLARYLVFLSKVKLFFQLILIHKLGKKISLKHFRFPYLLSLINYC